MQTRLTEPGYLSCEYNGYFGDSTQGALRRFQLDNGLTADGICDPVTWDTLFMH